MWLGIAIGIGFSIVVASLIFFGEWLLNLRDDVKSVETLAEELNDRVLELEAAGVCKEEEV